jgi:hypothetical protein
MGKKEVENFSAEETQRRLETALRGARTVGHKQMKDINPKRPKARRQKESRKHD